MSQNSKETQKFIVKELKDNPNHPANMYLTRHLRHDGLVDRGCAVLDGSCDCPNTGGSVPDACKYLKGNV